MLTLSNFLLASLITCGNAFDSSLRTFLFISESQPEMYLKVQNTYLRNHVDIISIYSYFKFCFFTCHCVHYSIEKITLPLMVHVFCLQEMIITGESVPQIFRASFSSKEQ